MRLTCENALTFIDTKDSSKFYFKIHKNNEITISKKNSFKKFCRLFGLTFGYHSYEKVEKTINEIFKNMNNSNLVESLESSRKKNLKPKVELRSKGKGISFPSMAIKMISKRQELYCSLDEKKTKLEENKNELQQLYLNKLEQKNKNCSNQKKLVKEKKEADVKEYEEFCLSFQSEYLEILNLFNELSSMLDSDNFESELIKISNRMDQLIKLIAEKKGIVLEEIVDLMESLDSEQLLSLLR